MESMEIDQKIQWLNRKIEAARALHGQKKSANQKIRAGGEKEDIVEYIVSLGFTPELADELIVKGGYTENEMFYSTANE